MFAKILDGCEINGKVWVYAAGLTDLPLRLLVAQVGRETADFNLPDGGVLRPNNGGLLDWCQVPVGRGGRTAIRNDLVLTRP